MADLKISQLTAATTPLAGTEVFPIVQSSSTKKATIANVQAAPVAAGTANGVQFLNASKVPTTGSALAFDGTNLGIGTNAPTRTLDVLGTQSFQDSAGERQLLIANDTTLVRLFSRNRSNNSGVPMCFYTGTTENLRINTNSDVTVNLGNLIQGTAAKGVNFTANTPAAGMTSQLLNWYEEGTWTPDQGAGLTLVGAFSSAGTYTRIGRQVFIRGSVSGATSVAVASAGAITTNLPYSAAADATGTAINAANNASSILRVSSATLTAATAIAATTTITFSAVYSV